MSNIIVRAGGDNFEDVTIPADARFRVIRDDPTQRVLGIYTASDRDVGSLAWEIDSTAGATWHKRMAWPLRKAMYRALRDGSAVYRYQRHDNSRYGTREYLVEIVS